MIDAVSDEDDTKYQIVRGRRKRDTDQQTPRALAKGSNRFGRELPDGVASAMTELARLQPRDIVQTIAFGPHAIRIEQDEDVVTLILGDGTRINGSIDDAHQLAVLLARIQPPR
jgi:hypothetical protein